MHGNVPQKRRAATPPRTVWATGVNLAPFNFLHRIIYLSCSAFVFALALVFEFESVAISHWSARSFVPLDELV
jgi:hypothetical protein